MNTTKLLKALAYIVAAFLLIGLLLVLLFFTSCTVPENKGWTRAEVKQKPEAQQVALDKDREACVAEGTAKGVYYQALMGSMDVTACLERRGWKRVP